MVDHENGKPDDEGFDPRNFNPEEFQKFMRRYLENPEQFDVSDLAEAAGLPTNPADLAKLFEHLGAALEQSGQLTDGVNWKIAVDQAKQVARQQNKAVLEAQRIALAEACSIGGLWLNSVTSVSELTIEPKLLTRDLWVDDALPLVKALSEPIADQMSDALTDHLTANAPEELGKAIESAGDLMKSAGGTLFAMQLGNAIGKLSEQVISGADLGLPIFSDQRAAFVPQNLAEFVVGLDVDQKEALIYLAVRELAHARLFKHSRWLRDHVVTQITNYASDISIDEDKIEELAEQQELRDPEQIRKLLESGALIAERTDDQERALESIETMLALIEGWVEAVAEEATKLLPKQFAIAEAVRRRRATGGPSEIMFGTLVGLQLRPRYLRESAAFWRSIGEKLGAETRDSLWNHPDMLPTAADIANPELLIKRLTEPQSDGDDLDRALRDLLGDQ